MKSPKKYPRQCAFSALRLMGCLVLMTSAGLGTMPSQRQIPYDRVDGTPVTAYP
jgi:hypothetical protein